MTSTINKFADCARLKDLTEGGADAASTFDSMAKLLSDFGRPARVQVRLEGDEPMQTFGIDITTEGASVTQQPILSPALEIICTHATWREIAAGKLSPLEAFARRHMRVFGSTQLGVEVLRHMRGSGSRTQLC